MLKGGKGGFSDELSAVPTNWCKTPLFFLKTGSYFIEVILLLLPKQFVVTKGENCGLWVGVGSIVCIMNTF